MIQRPDVLMIGYFPDHGAVAELFQTFSTNLSARVPVATLAPESLESVAGTVADFRFPYTTRRPDRAMLGRGWAAHRAAFGLEARMTLLFTQHPLNVIAATRVHRANLAFWWHEPATRGQVSRLKRLAYSANDRIVVPRASRILVASPSVREAVPAPHRKRVAIVPFPSPAGFREPSTRFDDRPTDLVYFGNVQSYKGLDTLADALQMLEHRGHEPTLRLVGSGDLSVAAPRLERFGRTCPGRLEHVDEYAPAADVASAIRASKVCVLPYLTAAGSSAIAIAGIHGTTLVASDAGSFGDFLTDGVDARLHPPGDAGALADALESVLADGLQRLRLGARLRETQTHTFGEISTTDALVRALFGAPGEADPV